MKFTGIWIPAGIASCDKLSDKAKIAYGLISSLDNDKGCFASNGYFGRILGIEERQVRNVIEELIDQGLVLRTVTPNSRILSTIEQAAVEFALADVSETTHGNPLPQGGQEVAAGGGKKLPTYNKGNNKGDRNKRKAPADNSLLDAMPYSTPAFIEAWNKWVDYRRDLKRPLHWKTINAIFHQMKSWGEQPSIDAINTSIEKGWFSLFLPNSTTFNKQPLTTDDHTKPW